MVVGVYCVGGYARTDVGGVVARISTEGYGGAYYTGKREWRLGFISPNTQKKRKEIELLP